MKTYYFMKERIMEFIRAENKTSAQFAEEIGVQPSGISHILSGRNNPSLDFILKMLEKYDYLSTEWLLFGKGDMYKDVSMQKLVDESKDNSTNDQMVVNQKVEQSDIEITKGNVSSYTKKSRSDNREAEKIVWFYNDNSFQEYLPEGE